MKRMMEELAHRAGVCERFPALARLKIVIQRSPKLRFRHEFGQVAGRNWRKRPALAEAAGAR